MKGNGDDAKKAEQVQKLRIGIAVGLAFTVLLVAAVGCAQRTAAIVVDQPDALFDVPVRIQVTGLEPGQVVTIGAQAADAQGRIWKSSGEFTADLRGEVDLAKVAPQSGSYSGVDPMGLLWSMKTSATTDPVGFEAADRTDVQLSVSAGGVTVAQRSIVRRLTVPGLTKQELTVAETGLFGVMFHPPNIDAPRPAVLIFGGAGDRGRGEVRPLITSTASVLASHGYPTLALAYYGAEGLPSDFFNIPLEYFGKALEYLHDQPGVDPHRMIAFGTSRGSEASQLLGVHYQDLVSGVIALVPSNVVQCNHPESRSPFSWQGQPVPCAEGASSNPAAIIPVERIQGPVFLNCGGQDPFGGFCRAAEASVARLDANHSPYQHILLSYPDTGHGIGFVLPYWPPPTTVGGTPLPGGTPETIQHARADIWPKLLDFINHLPG